MENAVQYYISVVLTRKGNDDKNSKVTFVSLYAWNIEGYL